jgi:choline dehydrogenase-like flavoprotein
MSTHYDVIVVGTGFAATFFLLRYLEHAPSNARVLVLERGNEDSKPWQLENQLTSSIAPEEVFNNLTPDKEWYTSPGFGGNSKCWLGGTTRFMPGDFKLKSRYGVGTDWPISYEDLAPHYDVVEQTMLISGPSDSPMPRSQPFPLPPHRLSDPDVLLKKRFPDGWYHMATSRASIATGKRGVCCVTGVCLLCPVDAKFTVQNTLAHLYKDPRVVLRLRATVETLETAAGIVQAVNYREAAAVQRDTADLVVLGASALFNPHILLRSGIDHPLTGKLLHEQLPVYVTLDLKGVKCYNGSTILSGLGYLFYEGEHRKDHAACMIETWSSPFGYRRDGALRTERGRWTERVMFGFLFDDIPQMQNTVSYDPKNPGVAQVKFTEYSEYAMRGSDRIPQMIDKLAEALPIERVVETGRGSTAAHIQGTVVMGDDPHTSVVDRYLMHHQYRNLLVLGASSFVSASPAYPTLTVSALSLWAADHVLGRTAG